jgi:hypothetical protein
MRTEATGNSGGAAALAEALRARGLRVLDDDDRNREVRLGGGGRDDPDSFGRVTIGETEDGRYRVTVQPMVSMELVDSDEDAILICIAMGGVINGQWSLHAELADEVTHWDVTATRSFDTVESACDVAGPAVSSFGRLIA